MFILFLKCKNNDMENLKMQKNKFPQNYYKVKLQIKLYKYYYIQLFIL